MIIYIQSLDFEVQKHINKESVKKQIHVFALKTFLHLRDEERLCVLSPVLLLSPD